MKPRILVPFLRHTLTGKELSFDSGSKVCSELYSNGHSKDMFPPATVAGLYSPLGHWCWPQAQNVSPPTTMLYSPSRDFPCLSDNWEWSCFYGSGKNIDNKVHVYWTTWHIKPELPWQVRLIQKLHSVWNSTHVSPKRRHKQWTPADGSCYLADNDKVVRPANRWPTNTGPSRGVIWSSQDQHNLKINKTKQVNSRIYIDANAVELSRPAELRRSCTSIDLS